MFPQNIPEMTPDLHNRLLALVQRLNAHLSGGKPGDGEWVLTILSGDDCETVSDRTLAGAVTQLERATAYWKGDPLPPPKQMRVWTGEVGDLTDTFVEETFACPPAWFSRQYSDQYSN